MSATECASKMSGAEQVNESAVRANGPVLYESSLIIRLTGGERGERETVGEVTKSWRKGDEDCGGRW